MRSYFLFRVRQSVSVDANLFSSTLSSPLPFFSLENTALLCCPPGYSPPHPSPPPFASFFRCPSVFHAPTPHPPSKESKPKPASNGIQPECNCKSIVSRCFNY